MRFQVNPNQLAKGAAWAARHLSTKPTTPVLAGKDGGEADYRHLIMPIRLSC